VGITKDLSAKITVKGIEDLKKVSAVNNLMIEANCTDKTSVEVTVSKT
jgi:hypothetical protein